MSLQDDVDVIKELESFSLYMIEDFKSINSQLFKIQTNQRSLTKKCQFLEEEFLNFRKKNKVKCVMQEKEKDQPIIENQDLTETKMKDIYARITSHQRLENENFDINRFDSDIFKKNSKEDSHSENSEFSVIYPDQAESIYEESIAIKSVIQSEQLDATKKFCTSDSNDFYSEKNAISASETLYGSEKILNDKEKALFDSEEEPESNPKISEPEISGPRDPQESRNFLDEIKQKFSLKSVTKMSLEQDSVIPETNSKIKFENNSDSFGKTIFLTTTRPKNRARKPPTRKTKQVIEKTENLDDFFVDTKKSFDNSYVMPEKADSISSVNTDELFD